MPKLKTDCMHLNVHEGTELYAIAGRDDSYKTWSTA